MPLKRRINGTGWEVIKIAAIIVGVVIGMLAALDGKIEGQVRSEVADETKEMAGEVEVLKATQILDRNNINSRLDRLDRKMDIVLERLPAK